MQAYRGANLIPIAVAEISCLISMLNSKKLFLRTNSANLTRSSFGIFEEDCSSNLLFNAEIPSLCGMLGYRPTTSTVTRKESSESFPILFILSKNSQSLECMTSRFALKALNEN